MIFNSNQLANFNMSTQSQTLDLLVSHHDVENFAPDRPIYIAISTTPVVNDFKCTALIFQDSDLGAEAV